MLMLTILVSLSESLLRVPILIASNYLFPAVVHQLLAAEKVSATSSTRRSLN